MEQLFVLEIREFLDSCSLKYYLKGNSFILPKNCINIILVSLNGCTSPNNEGFFVKENEANYKIGEDSGYREIRIYEDLWFTKGEIIRNRLKAVLGKGDAVYARKCRVANINSYIAREFLDKNHILGYSKSKFFYGLVYCDQLVAVAAFSASRPMTREGGVINSFEWVRYASQGSLRVIGGMGRLLGAFVDDQRPQEVMSYADLDWGGYSGFKSNGNAYTKLGFELIGKTAPVKFMVDPETYNRYSLKKLLKDRKYRNSSKNRDQEQLEKQYILLFNSGNLKFLRSFPFL